MTDKQIIIDGCDVSECPHIEYEHKWWNIAGDEQNSENVCALSFDKNADFEEDFLCQDNPNCYYKQLKRKEQECEELKNFHINLVGVKECEIRELAKYKQAIEKIKGICEFDFTMSKTNLLAKSILQICDEVENG
jgi:hypothetical protein